MPFTAIELGYIDSTVGTLCRKRSPEHIKDKLSMEYSVKGFDVLMYELRPVWNDPQRKTESAIAKFKYAKKSKQWTLYWQRANLKWLRYDKDLTGADLAELVDEVDQDSQHVFFG